MNRIKFLVLTVAVILVLLVIGVWAINMFIFQPREASRQATATAQAVAAATRVAQTATAEAGAFSVESQATRTAQADEANATATANAEFANATATKNAEIANAAATANAAAANTTATAQAAASEINRCRDANSYRFEVSVEPVLWPEIGYRYVTDALWPQVRAVWTVTLPYTISTDVQACAWESVALKTLGGETVAADMVELRRDGAPVDGAQPRESVELVLSFPRLGAPTSGEWLLVVNGLSLFDQPHLKLDTGGDEWVRIVTPTPTPTPIPTLAPIPATVPNNDNDGPPKRR